MFSFILRMSEYFAIYWGDTIEKQQFFGVNCFSNVCEKKSLLVDCRKYWTSLFCVNWKTCFMSVSCWKKNEQKRECVSKLQEKQIHFQLLCNFSLCTLTPNVSNHVQNAVSWLNLVSCIVGILSWTFAKQHLCDSESQSLLVQCTAFHSSALSILLSTSVTIVWYITMMSIECHQMSLV